MTTKAPAGGVSAGGVSFAAFLDAFVRVPDAAGRLTPLRLHAAQQAVVDAVDAVDATGARPCRELVCSWLKKAGKSTTLAAVAVWGLAADARGGPDREVIIAASDLAQSKDVVFATAARIVGRHPWLRRHCKVSATEIAFRQEVVEPATGGRYTQTHVLRAVPRDVRGLHGSNASLVIIDEAWTMDDYELLEALAPSAARTNPLTIYASYAGLVSQQRPGVPWFDLLQRARAGDDPALVLSELRGPEAWRAVPWITRRWVEQMRRTLPGPKFRRLVENEPSTGEGGGFVDPSELAAAVDATWREPEQGAPGTRYAVGVDLGVSHDWTGLVVAHVEAGTGAVVVDAVRWWRGTRARPVSLPDVEGEIMRLVARFPVRAVRIDQWQGRLLADRLAQRGVPAGVVTTESAWLDRAATTLRGLFAGRQIRLPRHEDLIAQLEGLRVEELRRDRLRYTTGAGGVGAAAHDDLVVALSLAIDGLGRDVGARRLPEAFRNCLRADYFATVPAGRRPLFQPAGCYLLGGGAVPSDPVCGACVGHVAVRQAWQTWGQAAGLDLRGVRALFGDNEFTSRRWQRVFEGFL